MSIPDNYLLEVQIKKFKMNIRKLFTRGIKLKFLKWISGSDLSDVQNGIIKMNIW